MSSFFGSSPSSAHAPNSPRPTRRALRPAALGLPLLAALLVAPGCYDDSPSQLGNGTWLDTVAVCNYRTVYLANQAAGKTGDLFEMTEACEAQLEDHLIFDGFDPENPIHNIVKNNYLRGLHMLLFQPAVRPQDDVLLDFPAPDELFPPASVALLGVAPNTVQQIPASYYNVELANRFLDNISTVRLLPAGDGYTMRCCGGDRHTMSVNQAKVAALGNDLRHWTAYILYHELQHLRPETAHVTCTGATADCDTSTDGAYGSQGAYLFALGVGGRSYLTPDGDPLMPATAAQSGQQLFGLPSPFPLASTQHLFVGSCRSLLGRVDPLRSLYFDDIKQLCAAEAIDAMVRLGYLDAADPLACPGLSGSARMCCLNQNDGTCDELTTSGALGLICATGQDPLDCGVGPGGGPISGSLGTPSSLEEDGLCGVVEDEWDPLPLGIVQRGSYHVIDGDRFDKELAEVADLLEDAHAETVTLADGSTGYQLTTLRPGSTFEQLGLRHGDIVTSVNGLPLTAAPTLQTALGWLSTEQASIGLRRGHDTLVLHYLVDR